MVTIIFWPGIRGAMSAERDEQRDDDFVDRSVDRDRLADYKNDLALTVRAGQGQDRVCARPKGFEPLTF
ncbi:MAG: hypothetical protein ACRDTA_21115 [Pseudonocardiaceae bacterium]